MRFETGDLLRMPLPRDAYDLVMCRNTVIYFTEEVRDALHGASSSPSRPAATWSSGSTERVARPARLGLTSTHPFIYRKG